LFLDLLVWIIASLPIKSDGPLGEPASIIQHKGSSLDLKRHPHSINPSPDNRFVSVGDLGRDKLLTYSLDADKAIFVYESNNGSLRELQAISALPDTVPDNF
jgi:6-phosphogluconolactonase